MSRKSRRVRLSAATLAMIALSGSTLALAQSSSTPKHHTLAASTVVAGSTTTPIQHVVVIYGENVSFDHYFATYPTATNPAGEPAFYAAPNTPSVNGLNGALLTNNPNLANPARLDRAQSITDDMDHTYYDEQKAFDGGLADKFVQFGAGTNWPFANQSPNVVMDYYDGNTVTALWNYAQHFSMNDNSFGTNFGPSTPGALNLISGQTHGAIAYSANVSQQNVTQLQPDATGSIIKNKLDTNGTIFSDIDPYYDNTSKGNTLEMTGQNVGDLLNAKGITWGWFEGGFRNNSSQNQAIGDGKETPAPLFTDYIPHHQPFQYYKSTSNPNHLPPSSVAQIGHQGDQANHQYDITDFWSAVSAGNMPAVSFLKAPAYQDGHAGYSGPLDEQHFVVNTINELEKTPDWSSTAVIINYDDSDGWYDHVMPPILVQSNDPLADALLGAGNAGKPAAGTYLDRAGYGPRVPMLVISPWAKRNYVDGTLTDQSSILRFIEDNWSLGQLGDQSMDAMAGSLASMFDFSHPSNSKLFLDPSTGEPVSPTVEPFQQDGKQYMAVTQLAEILNTNAVWSGKVATFMWNGHTVSIPKSGSKITVDGHSLDLGAKILVQQASLVIPVDNLVSALGIQAGGLVQGVAQWN